MPVDDDMIFDEVVEAAAKAVYETWCAIHGVAETSLPWSEIDDEERDACFAQARAAIAAALAAWPGGWRDDIEDACGVRRRLILPLTQESGR